MSAWTRGLSGDVLVFADIDGLVTAGYLGTDDRSLQRPILFPLDGNQRLSGRPSDLSVVEDLDAALARVRGQDRVEQPAPILLVPRALSGELCDELIARWHDHHEDSGVLSTAGGTTRNTTRSQRKHTLDHMVREPGLVRRVSQTLVDRVLPEITKAFTFSGGFLFDQHIVLSYGEGGQDRFDSHRDNLTPASRNRRFAISLNLNDDFEGGELVFPEYGSSGYRFAAATACVFSCSLPHAARPVRRGRRFVLTTFICDPTSRSGTG